MQTPPVAYPRGGVTRSRKTPPPTSPSGPPPPPPSQVSERVLPAPGGLSYVAIRDPTGGRRTSGSTPPRCLVLPLCNMVVTGSTASREQGSLESASHLPGPFQASTQDRVKWLGRRPVTWHFGIDGRANRPGGLDTLPVSYQSNETGNEGLDVPGRPERRALICHEQLPQ